MNSISGAGTLETALASWLLLRTEFISEMPTWCVLTVPYQIYSERFGKFGSLTGIPVFFLLMYEQVRQCMQRGVPVAAVIGGGYDKDPAALARRHATVHRAATAEWLLKR
jgi:hypothetical protein